MSPLLERRKEIVLGVLLVGFAVLLWHELGGPADGGRAVAARPGLASRVDAAGLKLFPVEWSSLSAVRPAYDPAGRNIFQFGVIPPPPPPKLTPQEEAAIREAQRKAEEERQRQAELLRAQQQAQQQALLQQQQTQANQPPPPPPRPQPPSIPYKFIGYIGPPENKIAVLYDGTDLVFASEGDEIGKGFRVLAIGYESIKFGYTDPRFKGDSQTLPMSSAF